MLKAQGSKLMTQNNSAIKYPRFNPPPTSELLFASNLEPFNP